MKFGDTADWKSALRLLRPLAALDRSRDAGVAGAAVGPTAQLADLFVHRPRQRHRLGQRGLNVFRPDFRAFVKRVVERAVDRLLDFRAAEMMAGISERCEIE